MRIGDPIRAAEILEKAADVLVTRGWTKGMNYRPTREGGSYCAVGALNRAKRELGYRSLDCDLAVFATYGILRRLGSRNLIAFNDKVAQEVGEVTDVFLQAAKDLRK